MKDSIQVIERACALLEAISSRGDQGVTVSELAKRHGLHASTVVRILHTLCQRNMTERIGRKKGYRLGWNLYRVSGNHERYFERLRLAANPLLERLASDVPEMIVLATLIGYRKKVVTRIQSRQEVVLNENVESVANPLASVTGKVLLAHLSKTELRQALGMNGPLPPEKWPELKTLYDLERDFRRIREDGLELYESGKTYWSVAAPVLENGKSVAALGCMTPSQRTTGLNKRDIVERVRETALAISQKLKSGIH